MKVWDNFPSDVIENCCSHAKLLYENSEGTEPYLSPQRNRDELSTLFSKMVPHHSDIKIEDLLNPFGEDECIL